MLTCATHGGVGNYNRKAMIVCTVWFDDYRHVEAQSTRLLHTILKKIPCSAEAIIPEAFGSIHPCAPTRRSQMWGVTTKPSPLVSKSIENPSILHGRHHRVVDPCRSGNRALTVILANVTNACHQRFTLLTQPPTCARGAARSHEELSWCLVPSHCGASTDHLVLGVSVSSSITIVSRQDAQLQLKGAHLNRLTTHHPGRFTSIYMK